VLERIAADAAGRGDARLQQVYQEPIKPELMAQRIREIKAPGGLARRGR